MEYMGVREIMGLERELERDPCTGQLG